MDVYLTPKWNHSPKVQNGSFNSKNQPMQINHWKPWTILTVEVKVCFLFLFLLIGLQLQHFIAIDEASTTTTCC